MFMPTGAYTHEHYKSGALESPPEQDRKVVESFIDSMTGLLPDDAPREKAEFQIEDMRFEVHPMQAVNAPPYHQRERKVRLLLPDCVVHRQAGICAFCQELLPPRHLQDVICRCKKCEKALLRELADDWDWD